MSSRKRGRPRKSTAEAIAAELGAEEASEAEGATVFEPNPLVSFLLSRVPSALWPELEQLARALAGAPEAQQLRSLLKRWQVLATFHVHEDVDGELRPVPIPGPGKHGGNRQRRAWLDAVVATAKGTEGGIEQRLAIAVKIAGIVWTRLGEAEKQAARHGGVVAEGHILDGVLLPSGGIAVPLHFEGLSLYGPKSKRKWSAYREQNFMDTARKLLIDS